MRRLCWSVLFVIAALGASACRAEPAVPRLQRVLIVSVDGLRPDLMLRANTPVLHGLMKRGSYTMWAQTTAVSITLPSHVSMLTGVTPGRHKIEWNTDLPLSHPVYPAVPTLFDLAAKAGLTTAIVTGKAKMRVLERPGSLTWSFVPREDVIGDAAVADSAVRLIIAHAPQVMFVHLPAVDTAGHDSGWSSPAQLAAIATADHCIGRILDALAKRRLLDSTCVLVSADHGGAGRTHGPDDPRSRNIPWIVAGPGLRKGYDLTADGDLVVRTEDTFGTACALLGLSPPPTTTGRFVSDILEPAPAHAGAR